MSTLINKSRKFGLLRLFEEEEKNIKTTVLNYGRANFYTKLGPTL